MLKQIISLIVAVGNNGVIGNKGKIPWCLPADFRYFKQITYGRPIIMGRKTHESIGCVLPRRKNIVISSQKEYKPISGAFPFSTLKEAIAFAGDGEIFIIGGAKIYEEAIFLAHKLYLTKIYGDFEGDTFFPEIKKDEWRELAKETRKADERNPYPLEWIVMERVKK